MYYYKVNISLQPGKYVVAVSGGVDSVVLLDVLSKDKNLQLIVAHFDHGIRQDSAKDVTFVKALAKKYQLKFYSKREELGRHASEATARKHRYNFLDEAIKKTKFNAIVTAHHQDDVIETALLNLLRGTKRKGLVSLKSTDKIKRPLLKTSKDQILQYARENKLEWREDSTNSDLKYKRNQVRSNIKKSLNQNIRQNTIALLGRIQSQNAAIDQLVNEYLMNQPDNTLNRSEINAMQLPEASEIVAGWLRKNKAGFDKKTIGRLIQGCQNLNTAAEIDIKDGYYCLLTKQQIILKQRESV